MIDEEQLSRDGATVVPLLDREQISLLLARFEQLALDHRHGFFASSNDLQRQRATDIDRAIEEIVGRSLHAVLPHHEPFLCSFLSKGSDGGAEVAFHQDLTYCDERAARSLIAWIPLVDVTTSNGALAIVPGSHRWSDGVRPSGLAELPTGALQAQFAARSTPIHLPGGTALLYDPALIHGSGPNLTHEPRVAVGVAMAPRGVPLVHLHQIDGTLKGYAVDRAYHQSQGLLSPPVGYPEIEVWAEPVTEQQLRHAMTSTERSS